jgi:hypothetical protein
VSAPRPCSEAFRPAASRRCTAGRCRKGSGRRWRRRSGCRRCGRRGAVEKVEVLRGGAVFQAGQGRRHAAAFGGFDAGAVRRAGQGASGR